MNIRKINKNKVFMILYGLGRVKKTNLFYSDFFITSKYYFYNLDLQVPSGTLGHKMTNKIGTLSTSFGLKLLINLKVFKD